MSEGGKEALGLIGALGQRVRYLEDRLRIVAETARVNAQHREGLPDCPGSMIATYVEAEVAHALAGHTDPAYGVDCDQCITVRDIKARQAFDQTTFAHVQCPECGDIVPIGVTSGEVVDGNLEIEPDLSEVWAHSWVHDAGSGG